MNEKQILVLNSGAMVEDVENVYAESFEKKCLPEEMIQIHKLLTEDNLKKIIHKTGDTITAIYDNKKFKSCTYENGTAAFNLMDLDRTEQRISALEETIDILLLEEMEV